MSQQALEQLRQLVAGLQDRSRFDHAVSRFETIETHISIVLLTGEYAYKFKKPIDLGFVDFTTLDRRRHYCEEELRLNRRLAPNLYLDVVTIGGTCDEPAFNVSPAIEYCVQMRQFPHTAELEHVLTGNGVKQTDIAELARDIAAFHANTDSVIPDSPFGTAAAVRRQCLDNFDTIGTGLAEPDLDTELQSLRQWTEAELGRCQNALTRRHDNGYVRECHGDMHVTNMIWLDNRIQVFDCIEFNEEFRWIDVMNEIAFLLMDLDMRGRSDLGHVFLNTYLEAGGDYDGLSLLNLFRVYRSLVRAKVACLRARQDGADDSLQQRFASHVNLACRYINADRSPALIITRGFSGSGKTTITDGLIPLTGAVRVRSDIERKRLEGLSASERSYSGIGQGLYDPSHTEQTYERLADCAQSAIRAGWTAIVDATFLQAGQRLRFHNLAQSLKVPFRILDCRAPESVLRERISRRAQRGSDASEADTAVLERQLSAAESISDQEREFVIGLDTQQLVQAGQLAEKLGLFKPGE